MNLTPFTVAALQRLSLEIGEPVDEVADALLRDALALRIPCTFCGAPKGEQCRRDLPRSVASWPHGRRRKAALRIEWRDGQMRAVEARS